MTYNPWPLGHIPKHLQRTELEVLKVSGYSFGDPREVITLFENKVAAFAGSKYAVAVDCCTHAMELSLRYQLHTHQISKTLKVGIPSHTYVSVPMMLKQLGFRVEFREYQWEGSYPLWNTRVVDGAVRWQRGMYAYPKMLLCLSFQIKKSIPIGRGGMVLTNDKDAADWIRLASYDGRDLTTPYDSPDHVKMHGYHYYMTPEDAARGILLMDQITFEGDSANWSNYPNVKEMLKLES